MNSKYRNIKMGICIFDVVCVFLSLLFSCQIILYYSETIAMYEKNNKTLYQNENSLMIYLHELFTEYAEVWNEINETEEIMESTEKEYYLRSYIDDVSAEISADTNSSVYVEKYFKVEREELRKILSRFDTEGKIKIDFFDMELSGSVLPIGDKIWLRYCDEDCFATGIIVQNPESNIGYKNVSAGMSIDDIRRQLPDLVVEKINCDEKTIYYLEVKQDDFLYYFISAGSMSEPTTLYIEKTDK